MLDGMREILMPGTEAALAELRGWEVEFRKHAASYAVPGNGYAFLNCFQLSR